jgi:hypothetical protein
VSTTSFNAIAPILHQLGWKAVKIDIVGAYLNANKRAQDPDILMFMPTEIAALYIKYVDPSAEELLDNNGGLYMNAVKGWYGLPHAGQQWDDTIDNLHTEHLHMTSNPYDSKVYFAPDVVAFVYVDDEILMYQSDATWDRIRRVFDKKFPGFKLDEGPKMDFLGMLIDFSHEDIRISLPGLIKKLVLNFEVTGMASTPSTLDLFDVDPDSPLLDKKRQQRFHTAVNTILYPATHGRWDLILTFSVLAKKVNCPTEQDWQRLMRLLKYLNASADKYLSLRADELSVHYAADTSHIVHRETGRGHLGAGISLGKHAPCIWATSTTMKIVTRSTAETEMVGFTEKLPIALWLTRLLNYMGLIDDTMVHGWQDNEATITLIHAGRPCSARTRHIDVRAFWAKDYIDSEELEVNHQLGTTLDIDGLSKPKAGIAFETNMDGIMGIPEFD